MLQVGMSLMHELDFEIQRESIQETPKFEASWLKRSIGLRRIATRLAAVGLSAGAASCVGPPPPGKFPEAGRGCTAAKEYISTYASKSVVGIPIKWRVECPYPVPGGHQAMTCANSPGYCEGFLIAFRDLNVCPAAIMNEASNSFYKRNPQTGAIVHEYLNDPFGYCGQPGNPRG